MKNLKTIQNKKLAKIINYLSDIYFYEYNTYIKGPKNPFHKLTTYCFFITKIFLKCINTLYSRITLIVNGRKSCTKCLCDFRRIHERKQNGARQLSQVIYLYFSTECVNTMNNNCIR